MSPWSRPSAVRRRPAVLLAAALVATACGSAPSEDAAGPYGSMHGSLCQARDADDPDVTELAFERGAHAELHTLADEVAEVDRAAAAELLVSKNQVERRIQQDAPHDEVTDAVAALVEEVGQAVERLGHPHPGDC